MHDVEIGILYNGASDRPRCHDHGDGNWRSALATACQISMVEVMVALVTFAVSVLRLASMGLGATRTLQSARSRSGWRRDGRRCRDGYGRCQLVPEVPAKNGGFSLIETVIVIGVFGTLMAIAGPPMAGALQAAKTRSAAQRLTSAHSLARATAIRFGRRAELHLDAANAQFWVEVDTSQAGGVTDTVRMVHSVGDGQLVMTTDRALLCFNGRGLPTEAGPCQSGDANVIFSMPGRADTVRTTVLGKVLR